MNAITIDEREVLEVDQRAPAERVIQSAQQATPALLLQMAVQQGADLAKLEKLMELQERWEANDARKAFVTAKAAFKCEPITVTKDKKNAQFDSRYTSLGHLVATVTPFLSKHGLSASWDQRQDGGLITVTCMLSHCMGHTECTSFTVPKDDSGKKNAIQQIKSAITYAKAVTFESVCGLASTDANEDDDGNGAGEPPPTGAPSGEATRFYPEEGFKKNLPTWLKLIADGKKTAEQIFATVQTKFPLTEAQKAQIRGDAQPTK